MADFHPGPISFTDLPFVATDQANEEVVLLGVHGQRALIMSHGTLKWTGIEFLTVVGTVEAIREMEVTTQAVAEATATE